MEDSQVQFPQIPRFLALMDPHHRSGPSGAVRLWSSSWGLRTSGAAKLHRSCTFRSCPTSQWIHSQTCPVFDFTSSPLLVQYSVVFTRGREFREQTLLDGNFSISSWWQVTSQFSWHMMPRLFHSSLKYTYYEVPSSSSSSSFHGFRGNLHENMVFSNPRISRRPPGRTLPAATVGTSRPTAVGLDFYGHLHGYPAVTLKHNTQPGIRGMYLI